MNSPRGTISAGTITALVFALAAILYAIRPNLVLGDPDIWWHVHIGRDIIANRAVPYTDQYSYTFAGQPWIAKEWLSQALLGAAHNLAGWNGVMLLTLAAAAGAIALLHREMSRHLDSLLAALIALAIAVVLMPIVIARPHVFTLPLLVIFTARLFEASSKEKPPPWWLIAIVILWANLHGSFTLALAVAGFAFLDLVERNRFRTPGLALRWIAFGLLLALATLATPYGFKLYTINFDMLAGVQTMPFITEWQPFSAGRDRLMFFGLIASVAALVAMRANPGLARLALVAFALYMFLRHVRFVYVFFLVTPLIVAAAAANATPAIARREASSTSPLPAFAILALTLAGFIAWAAFQPFKPSDRRAIAEALAYVKEQNLTGPQVNGYNLGGVLMFNGYKTFLDGRTEQLFRGAFMDDYLAAAGPDGGPVMQRILDNSKAQWTIFPKRDPRNRHIETLPGWRKTYEDDWVIIHQRSAPP